MNPTQKAEMDVVLAGPEEKDEMVAKQNALAMRALGGVGMIAPPPKRKDADGDHR